ncbi:phospholipid scramblase-related protein [Nitrospirota bacterium]
MEKLASVNQLAIRQKKELFEAFTNFETMNTYSVMDATGNELYAAAEYGGSWFLRVLLKAYRPFKIQVVALRGGSVLELHRPFRFYFHHMDIMDAGGRLLGTIEKQFSFARRKYLVKDSSGNTVYELFGPILKPWTFFIQIGDRELGKITKKWSGLLKEGFTDADNFGIEFPDEADVNRKALLLGAVFLIDFVHFEDKGN